MGRTLGSKIITNAHKINEGKMPELSRGKSSDFFFIPMGSEDKSAIVNEIIDLCTNRLPKYYKVDPIIDIQVLTPMRRGETGADNLNIMLQATLNKNTLLLRRSATEYRIGDKVMHIKITTKKYIQRGYRYCKNGYP